MTLHEGSKIIIIEEKDGEKVETPATVERFSDDFTGIQARLENHTLKWLKQGVDSFKVVD